MSTLRDKLKQHFKYDHKTGRLYRIRDVTDQRSVSVGSKQISTSRAIELITGISSEDRALMPTPLEIEEQKKIIREVIREIREQDLAEAIRLAEENENIAVFKDKQFDK